MTTFLSKFLRFQLERWIQRGIFHQFLLMAAAIALVAVLGGLMAWLAAAKFAGPAQAIWWAFLRLTDPGYLGDDEGVALRAVSTVVTILGYVLFMGSLIAIMSQWLARTIRELESGRTPITMKDHIVILGWTNRTPAIVSRLLGARGRLQRFLDRHGVSKLRVVILAPEVNAQLRHELRDHLQAVWDERRIFLRSGSSLQPEHLQRLDLARAAAVVIPGADFALCGAESNDTRVVKTLLTINHLFRSQAASQRPDIVAELFDPLKVDIAQDTLAPPPEIVVGDAIIARLMAHSVRCRRLARVLLQILSHHRSQSLYVRAFPEFVGTSPAALNEVFPKAIVLGALRRDGTQWRPHLNPSPDFCLAADDQLVFLAMRYDDCVPASHSGWRRRWPAPASTPLAEGCTGTSKRILVLGWSHKIGALIAELGGCGRELCDLTVMSRMPIGERERWLARIAGSSGRVQVHHVEGDYTLRQNLEQIDPMRFNNIVMLASGWRNSPEEYDARAVLGYVLLTSMLKGKAHAPEIVVELLDPENARLLSAQHNVFLVSPLLLSNMMAHVALRRELNGVFNALFGAAAVQLLLRRASDYGLAERVVTFDDIQRTAIDHGEIALGLLCTDDALALHPHLNPAREASWRLEPGDELIVLNGRSDPASLPDREAA